MAKNAVVAGGAGFLGANLCRRLLRDNFTVVVLDNLSTGAYSNIKNLEKYKNFKFIKHDITVTIDIEADWIFNLACPASPPRYQKDPIQTTKTSVLGSMNLLELARKNNARILQASTSEVYGDPVVHPQEESYRGNVNPIGIRSCYDEGKRCAESLFFDYSRMYGVDIKVVRIFNTYGPYMDQDDGRVVSNFIVKALKNESLEIYGDGLQTRSFCYVDNMIDGFMSMMNSDVTGPINLGNPNEFTVKELTEIVLRLTNSDSEVLYKDLPEDDPTKRKPNIELAKTVLGWCPEVQLEEGLNETITYFKGILLATSDIEQEELRCIGVRR